jgi:hypothetical protein
MDIWAVPNSCGVMLDRIKGPGFTWNFSTFIVYSPSDQSPMDFDPLNSCSAAVKNFAGKTQKVTKLQNNISDCILVHRQKEEQKIPLKACCWGAQCHWRVHDKRSLPTDPLAASHNRILACHAVPRVCMMMFNLAKHRCTHAVILKNLNYIRNIPATLKNLNHIRNVSGWAAEWQNKTGKILFCYQQFLLDQFTSL